MEAIQLAAILMSAALLASMVEGVLAVDRDLRVTFCNSSFARAVQARDPLPERLPVVEVVRDPQLLDLLRKVLSTGQPQRRRLTLAAAAERVFEAQGAPVGPQPAMGAIAVLHDITEVERLERVRKDFVANISHELRTPLAAIRGYAETLLDGASQDPGNNRKFLEIICRNTVRLGDMASDLLALSELEAEREPPPAERVSVREVAAMALRTVESEAVARGVDVSAGAIEDVHVMGQRFRLEHALVNLLANAIRFNRPGGEVRVEAVAAGGEVRIRVSDTGIGIPFQDLPRIFEPAVPVWAWRSSSTWRRRCPARSAWKAAWGRAASSPCSSPRPQAGSGPTRMLSSDGLTRTSMVCCAGPGSLFRWRLADDLEPVALNLNDKGCS